MLTYFLYPQGATVYQFSVSNSQFEYFEIWKISRFFFKPFSICSKMWRKFLQKNTGWDLVLDRFSCTRADFVYSHPHGRELCWTDFQCTPAHTGGTLAGEIFVYSNFHVLPPIRAGPWADWLSCWGSTPAAAGGRFLVKFIYIFWRYSRRLGRDFLGLGGSVWRE